MTRRTLVLGLLLLVGLVAAPTANAALVIKASPGGIVSLGGFQPGRDPSLAAAVSYFGRPSFLTSSCRARWSRLALTIIFENFGGASRCDRLAFVTQAVRIQGRHAKRWRTIRGLRVGDSTRRVRRLYRSAQRHGGSYWLVWRRTNLGTADYEAVLEALTRHGRVYAFRLWEGAAGE